MTRLIWEDPAGSVGRFVLVLIAAALLLMTLPILVLVELFERARRPEHRWGAYPAVLMGGIDDAIPDSDIQRKGERDE